AALARSAVAASAATSAPATAAVPASATATAPGSASATPFATAPVLAFVSRGSPLDPLPHVFQHLWSVRLSADGTRISGVKAGAEAGELWWGTVDRGTLARLTFEGEHRDPIWKPDGRAIVFAARAGGVFNLFERTIDGTDAPGESRRAHIIRLRARSRATAP